MIQLKQIDLCQRKKPGFLCVLNLGVGDGSALTRKYFSKKEKMQLAKFQSQKRIDSFVAGRAAAKVALSRFIGEPSNMKQISVENGYFRQPYADHLNVSMSISHSHEIGGAFVGPAGIPLALDIEKIDERFDPVLSQVIHDHHSGLAASTPFEKVAIWSAMEALSKALQTGFTTSMSIYRISRIQRFEKSIDLSYEYFPAFIARSFLVGAFVITLVLPKNIEPPLSLEMEL